MTSQQSATWQRARLMSTAGSSRLPQTTKAPWLAARAPPPPPSTTSTAVRKRIESPASLKTFQKSAAYADILAYINELSTAVATKKLGSRPNLSGTGIGIKETDCRASPHRRNLDVLSLRIVSLFKSDHPI